MFFWVLGEVVCFYRESYVRRSHWASPGLLFLRVLAVAAGCSLSVCVCVLSSITTSLPLFQISALCLPGGYQGKCSLSVFVSFFHTVKAAPTTMALTSLLHPLLPSSADDFLFMHSLKIWSFLLFLQTHPCRCGFNFDRDKFYQTVNMNICTYEDLPSLPLVSLYAHTQRKTSPLHICSVCVWFCNFPKTELHHLPSCDG